MLAEYEGRGDEQQDWRDEDEWRHERGIGQSECSYEKVVRDHIEYPIEQE